jgi:LacI family transcriptional regulator
MTVSNVLNAAKPVREATRQAVLKAVEDLGYVPNAAARDLATAGSTRIGVLYFNVAHTFVSAMLVGALNVAARSGAQIIARQCDSFEFEDTAPALAALARAGANGILIYPPICNTLSGTDFMARLGVPVCVVAQGDPLPDMDTVGLDEIGAARTMTEYLLARGHRRIGLVAGDFKHPSASKRVDGYEAALRAHGIEVDPALIAVADYRFEGGAAATHVLLDLAEPPTAIFASNDDMAAGVSLVAHQRGLRVPQDLAIAGFDDSFFATRVWPQLTTLRQDVTAMSERATELLIARHRSGDTASPPRSERLPYEVIERQSA